jgi:hypothetical protein
MSEPLMSRKKKGHPKVPLVRSTPWDMAKNAMSPLRRSAKDGQLHYTTLHYTTLTYYTSNKTHCTWVEILYYLLTDTIRRRHPSPFEYQESPYQGLLASVPATANSSSHTQTVAFR